MIQRIQTVWLFLASLTILLLFLFPYLQYFDNFGTAMAIKITGIYQGITDGIIQTESFILQTIATVLVALLPLVIIFFYADRKKQLQLSYLNLFLIILMGIWLYFTAAEATTTVNKTLQLENIGIGALLIPIAGVFILLAIKGIRKDEKLIKSVDRLRG
ncbi:DUF4293 domain-containing protein [Albibacterium profundi]|uniref:DUF4293 domain-containing protein n=1 Tax=Albibacterium profundi TaxID=3134906 RepID=A0ABV5CF55_9SPHI